MKQILNWKVCGVGCSFFFSRVAVCGEFALLSPLLIVPRCRGPTFVDDEDGDDEPHDITEYKQACSKLDTVPVSQVVNDLLGKGTVLTKMDLAHHGIANKGALTLANALEVRLNWTILRGGGALGCVSPLS